MAATRKNGLNPLLDIQGSPFQNGPAPSSRNRDLSEEVLGVGAPINGQAGSGATLTLDVEGGTVATVVGLTNMSPDRVGNFLRLWDTDDPTNSITTGVWLIISWVSNESVKIAVPPGNANDDTHDWAELLPYTLADDLDFERLDRARIKGALVVPGNPSSGVDDTKYDADIPGYSRPTATDVNVPANLTNIAGKTLDAKGFVFTRKAGSMPVAVDDTSLDLSSPGDLKHADDKDKTGVPCWDTPAPNPYFHDYNACYVDLLSAEDGSRIVTSTGRNVYGLSVSSGLTSPDKVRIAFYSVVPGGDISTTDAAPYTWEAGLPTSVDVFYGYFEQLDQVSESALRTMQSLGVEESATLRQDVTDLQSVVGIEDGDTSLIGKLPSTGNDAFTGLDPSPSVVMALNELNAQIGDRTYDGGILHDKETIAASLQFLQEAIEDLSSDLAGSGVTRYITRLDDDVLANNEILLPGGADYVKDSTNNGVGLSVFTRGILRDPGSVANGDDYAETDTTHVTFFSTLKAGDHVNFYVYNTAVP